MSYRTIEDGQIIDDGILWSLSNLVDKEQARKLISLAYRPSASSVDLQEFEQKEVSLDWYIEIIDDKSIYVVLDFSDAALVSQKNNDLDRLEFEMLHIDAFVNAEGKMASTPETTVVEKVPTLLT